jgi:hypothetical protein
MAEPELRHRNGPSSENDAHGKRIAKREPHASCLKKLTGTLSRCCDLGSPRAAATLAGEKSGGALDQDLAPSAHNAWRGTLTR